MKLIKTLISEHLSNKQASSRSHNERAIHYNYGQYPSLFPLTWLCNKSIKSIFISETVESPRKSSNKDIGTYDSLDSDDVIVTGWFIGQSTCN